MATAALGGEIEAPCLLGGENCDGNCKIRVKVPEGAQTGRTVRLKGKRHAVAALARPRRPGGGAVHRDPDALTARQKELMRELAGLYSEQQHPRSAGFFQKARQFWDDIAPGGRGLARPARGARLLCVA